MLNNFLFFFEETKNNWGALVMLGILIVLIVVFMIFNARSKKTRRRRMKCSKAIFRAPLSRQSAE